MPFYFRNRKKSNPVAFNDAQDNIARSIMSRCLQWQKRWADWMQEKTERLSAKGKLVTLLLFCSITGCYSIYLIAASFSGNRNYALSVTAIKKPQFLSRSGDERIIASSDTNKEDYLKVQHFKKYIDSLVRSPEEKAVYDSILTSHPGLMDSIRFIEKNYQSQLKNK